MRATSNNHDTSPSKFILSHASPSLSRYIPSKLVTAIKEAAAAANTNMKRFMLPTLLIYLGVLTPVTEAFSPPTTKIARSSSLVGHGGRTRMNIGTILEEPAVDIPESVETTDTIVCGAGPAGLLSAIMLAQKFPKKRVTVFDRLTAPPSPSDEAVWSNVAKFYLIGLGGRGQKALAEFGVWDEVEAVCTAVVGRRDWSPESEDGVERIFTDRPVTTQVLPRDKLVGVLYEHILKNYADQIDLNFGYEVTPIDFESGDGTNVVVRVSRCDIPSTARVNPSATSASASAQASDKIETLCNPEESTIASTNLLIAADGTSRTIANCIEADDKRQHASMNPIRRLFAGERFKVKRYKDDNQRIYKTVPMKIPEGWRPDLNYSARTKDGRVVFDALPANRNGEYCGVLLLREDDVLSKPNSDPKELRALFDESLPQFTDLVDDETIAQIARKLPSFLPAFRYVGPRLHQGHRTIILGDGAHTVKPYFGLGANSALEDVKFLSEAIDATNNDLTEAVHKFSNERAGEAKALVRISRELDRPGAVGFLTFVLPLILDSIFNKMAPKIFAPNVITMLQKEGYGFRRVARRKRTDRLLQVVIIGSVLTGMVFISKLAVGLVAEALGRRTSTIFAGTAALLAATILAKNLAGYLVPGMAPADVLTKTNSKVTDSSETMENNDIDKSKKVEIS